MVRGEARDRKPGKAVTYPALQDQTANKGRWSSRSHTKHRRATAFFKHLPGSERCIALADHAVMMRGVRRCVVQQIPVRLLDARTWIHRNRLVDVTFLPVTATLPKEPQLA